MTTQLICLGEAVADLVEGPTDVFTRYVGGAPVNVAVAAARSGLQTSYRSVLGDDAAAYTLRSTLDEARVDCSSCKEQDVKTMVAFAALAAQPGAAETSYSFFLDPHTYQLDPLAFCQPSFSQHQIIHFGAVALAIAGLREAVISAVSQAHRAGAMISFDVNWRSELWPHSSVWQWEVRAAVGQADLVKVNAQELHLLTDCDAIDEGIATLMKEGVKAVLLTQGGAGSRYVDQFGHDEHVAAYTVQEVADTIGAGDVFTGAFLAALMQLEPLGAPPLTKIAGYSSAQVHRAMAYASCAAGLSTRFHGGTAAPFRAQVEEALQEWK
ncbi:MAG: hypothetical protein IMW91_06895 [Firmicutes bacterium]|nr:hypothetical protein [Bacillota bacterium]